MKTLRIIFRFFKAAIERYNNYKVEYLYSLLVVFPLLFPPIMWYLIIGEGEIAGWTFNRFLSLSILYGLLINFLDVIGFWNVWVWIEREERANLSSMLTKPINPVLYVYGINFFPAALIKLVVYFPLLAYLFITNNFFLSLPFILISLFSFLSVFLFLSSIVALMLSYDKSATPLMYIIWNFLKLGDMPISSLRGVEAFFLTYIIPVAFIAVVPAHALESNDYSMLIPSFLMFLFTYLIFRVSLWHSLKRFEAIGG